MKELKFVNSQKGKKDAVFDGNIYNFCKRMKKKTIYRVKEEHVIEN